MRWLKVCVRGVLGKIDFVSKLKLKIKFLNISDERKGFFYCLFIDCHGFE